MYLIDSTHPCDGSYVVGDGDQRRSGQVLLTDAVSLLFAHHVTKTVKEQTVCMRQQVLPVNINWQEEKTQQPSTKKKYILLCFIDQTFGQTTAVTR